MPVSTCHHANGGTASADTQCLLIAKSAKYLYIDVDYDGSDSTNWVKDIINFNTVSHSIIQRGVYRNALQAGLFLKSSTEGIYENIHVRNVHDTVNNLNSSTFGDGIRLESSTNNIFKDIRVQQNAETGMQLNASTGNTIIGIKGMRNGDIGLWLNTGSNNNTEGIIVDWTNPIRNSIMAASSANNTHGLHISFGYSNNVHDFVSSHCTYNMQLDYKTTFNVFSGILKLGNATTDDCWTDAGTGIDDTACANTDSSTATLTLGISNVAEFKLKNGTTTAFGGITDWLISTEFFNWAASNGIFPANTHQGPSSGGSQEQWDWRLASTGGSHLLNARAVPTGSSSFTHTWAAGSTSTILLNAREIHPMEGIAIGNVGDGDFLCESGESCVINQNISAYQGDAGTIVRDSANDITTGGAITNVEMWKYNTNGVP